MPQKVTTSSYDYDITLKNLPNQMTKVLLLEKKRKLIGEFHFLVVATIIRNMVTKDCIIKSHNKEIADRQNQQDCQEQLAYTEYY